MDGNRVYQEFSYSSDELSLSGDAICEPATTLLGRIIRVSVLTLLLVHGQPFAFQQENTQTIAAIRKKRCGYGGQVQSGRHKTNRSDDFAFVS